MDAKKKLVKKSERDQPKERLASHPPRIKTNSSKVEYFKDIVATIREPLVVLDTDLRVLAANRSFYKFFKVKQKETIGNRIYDLGNRQWDIPALRTLLETILPKKAVFNDYQVEHDFPTIGRRILLLNARKISTLPKEAKWILLAFEDVTERTQLERALQASEKRFHAVFETASDSMLLVDRISGRVLNSNRAARDSLGYSNQKLLKKNLWQLGILKDRRQFRRMYLKLEEQGVVGLVDTMIPTSKGGNYPADITIMDRTEVIQCNIREITERKQAEETLHESEEKFRSLFNNSEVGMFRTRLDGSAIQEFNQKLLKIVGHTLDEVKGKPFVDMWADKGERDRMMQMLKTEGHVMDFEFGLLNKRGEVRRCSTSMRLYSDTGILEGSIQDITERKWAEDKLAASEAELRALFASMTDVVIIYDIEGRYIHVAPTNPANLYLRPDEMLGKTLHEVLPKEQADYIVSMIQTAIQNGQVVNGEYSLHVEDREIWFLASVSRLSDTTALLVAHDITWRKRVEEDLIIANKELLYENEEKEKRAAELVLANKELAYQNEEKEKRAAELILANEETVRRLQNIQALRKIDQAIAGSLDLTLTLNVVLEQVKTQLNVDTAAVLLLDPHTQMLEFAAGIGFRSKAIESSHLRLGEGLGGRAALERTTVNITNLLENSTQFDRATVLADEGFATYFRTPLIAKGQVNGVLEVFHRSPFAPDENWLEFLKILAGQAAIAVDSASLFTELKQSNTQLFAAYDSTIEGWSHALDLRDKETEGHTQRVTEMTLKLARAAGITEGELVHVRRGALLHDIGKMGVPDHILLKPDKLTDEEWVVMRKHPTFAFELLSPIAYLRPALDIPYCHHEKWDGTGYPRGLKGEQIPLTARLFAIVDVWDALRSDRPYRKAWPEDRVQEHVHSLVGTHFDPKATGLFLNMMNEDEKNAG
jgi:PAS domain S-box-containing protein